MEWTNAHNLMYFLFGMSHLTDAKVSDEEKAATIKIAKEWLDGSDDDFEFIYREVQGEYLKDIGFPNYTKEGWLKVQKQTLACAKAFATNSTGDATDNISFLLKDSIALFKSDGDFSEAEKNLIDKLAEHWDVDKDWLYDGEIEEEDDLDEMIEDFLENYNEESIDNETSQLKVTMEMIQQGFDGKGLFEPPDGAKYEGEFKRGKFNGYGTFTWPDGENYCGDFEDGMMCGKGIYNSANGDVYDGEFKNGEKSGSGKFTHGPGDWEGDVYEGEWKNDQRSGHGVITFGSGEFKGEKYDGQWKDGKRNGKGTYDFADGTSFIGTWKDGECVEKEVELKTENKVLSKDSPIWEIIQHEFINLGKGASVLKKEFSNLILSKYPHIKKGTLSAQIAIQVINKRSRTNYNQCGKERVCGDDKFDFLFEQEDKTLCKYDKSKHGIWEIYKRDDGKLDVRIVSK